jgi:succinyl-CoA:(S)-malate CoA-transferase subunit A
VIPRLSATPGRITNLGPKLGNATTDVLHGLLGVQADELQRLREAKVV